MSAYHEIFLRTAKPFDEVVEDVSEAVGSKLVAVPQSNGTSLYRAVSGLSVVEVEPSHEYEDDYGMDFSRFPTLVTVRDLGSDKDREEATARSIVHALAETGGYQGLLVFDLKRKLCEI